MNEQGVGKAFGRFEHIDRPMPKRSIRRTRMARPNKFSVLYVDDDEDSCFMLQTLLGFSDIDVSSERTVKGAFLSAEARHFDLFLLASRFEIGNGFELCRDLHKFSPKTPIVFYTGDARTADRQQALDAGANAFVAKPDSDAIESLIASYVTRNAITLNH
jgi:CheY-like chemotaxis protein